MNKDHIDYYEYLEELRISGITNMFGAVPYLMEVFNLSRDKAGDVLSEWMNNYNEISKELGWKR